MQRSKNRSVGQPLTTRETEVLWQITEGHSNKEIASRLNLSEHTVKFHVGNALKKIGTSSRTRAAVLFTLQQGPVQNTQEAETATGEQNWIRGFAAALAQVHRHGGTGNVLYEAARAAGFLLASALSAGISPLDIEELRRAKVP